MLNRFTHSFIPSTSPCMCSAPPPGVAPPHFGNHWSHLRIINNKKPPAGSNPNTQTHFSLADFGKKKPPPLCQHRCVSSPETARPAAAGTETQSTSRRSNASAATALLLDFQQLREVPFAPLVDLIQACFHPLRANLARLHTNTEWINSRGVIHHDNSWMSELSGYFNPLLLSLETQYARTFIKRTKSRQWLKQHSDISAWSRLIHHLPDWNLTARWWRVAAWPYFTASRRETAWIYSAGDKLKRKIRVKQRKYEGGLVIWEWNLGLAEVEMGNIFSIPATGTEWKPVVNTLKGTSRCHYCPDEAASLVLNKSDSSNFMVLPGPAAGMLPPPWFRVQKGQCWWPVVPLEREIYHLFLWQEARSER